MCGDGPGWCGRFAQGRQAFTACAALRTLLGVRRDAPHARAGRGAHIGTGMARWQSFVAFGLLIVANLSQHTWHPPLALVEAAAVEEDGPRWRETFTPFKNKKWTPAHEVRLQDLSGKGVYLTCQTIFVQMVYQGLSLLVSPSRPRLTKAIYMSSAFIHGFGVLCCMLWAFFWALTNLAFPEWREQWNFFEARGYWYYRELMILVHVPSLISAVLDVVTKDPAMSIACCPSGSSLALAVLAWIVYYHVSLYIHYVYCGGAIPYPWVSSGARPLHLTDEFLASAFQMLMLVCVSPAFLMSLCA